MTRFVRFVPQPYEWRWADRRKFQIMFSIDSNTVYIPKEGTWFDRDTIVSLIDDYRPKVNSGLFRGTHNGMADEEVCSFDEFDQLRITRRTEHEARCWAKAVERKLLDGDIVVDVTLIKDGKSLAQTIVLISIPDMFDQWAYLRIMATKRGLEMEMGG